MTKKINKRWLKRRRTIASEVMASRELVTGLQRSALTAWANIAAFAKLAIICLLNTCFGSINYFILIEDGLKYEPEYGTF